MDLIKIDIKLKNTLVTHHWHQDVNKTQKHLDKIQFCS